MCFFGSFTCASWDSETPWQLLLSPERISWKWHCSFSSGESMIAQLSQIQIQETWRFWNQLHLGSQSQHISANGIPVFQWCWDSSTYSLAKPFTLSQVQPGHWSGWGDGSSSSAVQMPECAAWILIYFDPLFTTYLHWSFFICTCYWNLLGHLVL